MLKTNRNFKNSIDGVGSFLLDPYFDIENIKFDFKSSSSLLRLFDFAGISFDFVFGISGAVNIDVVDALSNKFDVFKLKDKEIARRDFILPVLFLPSNIRLLFSFKVEVEIIIASELSASFSFDKKYKIPIKLVKDNINDIFYQETSFESIPLSTQSSVNVKAEIVIKIIINAGFKVELNIGSLSLIRKIGTDELIETIKNEYKKYTLPSYLDELTKNKILNPLDRLDQDYTDLKYQSSLNKLKNELQTIQKLKTIDQNGKRSLARGFPSLKDLEIDFLNNLYKFMTETSIVTGQVAFNIMFEVGFTSCLANCRDPIRNVGLTFLLEPDVNGELKFFGLAKVFNKKLSVNPFYTSVCLPNLYQCEIDPETGKCSECILCPDGKLKRKKKDGQLGCPCECEDGSEKEQLKDRNGECDCSCKCADKSTDKLTKEGCPCECECSTTNCRKSKRINYPRTNNCDCPLPGECQWVNCKLDCCKTCPPPPVPPPPPPRARGDIHFCTLDGYCFDFQEVGDFTFCQDELNDFGIQIRLDKINKHDIVSWMTGLAIQISKNQTLNILSLNKDKPQISLDETLIKEDKYYNLTRDILIAIDLSTNNIRVEKDSFFFLSISYSYFYSSFVKSNFGYFNLNFRVSEKLSTTRGLCGSFDSNLFNDLTGPNEQLIKDPIEFGLSWKLSDNNSIKTTWLYNKSNILKYDFGFKRTNILRSNLISDATASEVCKKNDLTGVSLNDCILDVISGQNTQIADDNTFKSELCKTKCSNQGLCTGIETCRCYEGWSGKDCSEAVCKQDCGLNGLCDRGFCKCNQGYDGENCTQKADCSQMNNCTSQLNGICTKTNTCLCYDGFTGLKCDQQVDCSKFNNCSNNGYCIDNKCKCKRDWTSEDCSISNCASLSFCSGNGKCIGNNLCECDENWLGEDCSIPSCNQVGNCSNFGQCVSVNQCKCDQGYSGSDCSQTINCSELKNCSNKGRCRFNKTKNLECLCFTGYKGEYCDQIDCSKVNNCSNTGKCIEPNICECDSKYGGKNCSELSCSNLNFCSSNGECLLNETCKCKPGYSGEDCSIPSCDQVNNCSNSGVCVSFNECVCYKGFDSDNCSLIIGENLNAPKFNQSNYYLNLTDLMNIDTSLLTVLALDDDSGRNGLVSYDFINNCLGILKINTITGEIKLAKSLINFEKNECSGLVEAFDFGTPKKFSTANIFIKISKIATCDDLFNSFDTNIKLKYQEANLIIAQLKPNVSNLNKNVSYYFDDRINQLSGFIKMDENNGIIKLSKNISAGSYLVNVHAIQNVNGFECKDSISLKINVLTSNATFQVDDNGLTTSSFPTITSSTLSSSVSTTSTATKTTTTILTMTTTLSSSVSTTSTATKTTTTILTMTTTLSSSVSTTFLTTSVALIAVALKMSINLQYIPDYHNLTSEKSLQLINNYNSFVI
jgi:hypothetical protein